jgi:hypothetical protein
MERCRTLHSEKLHDLYSLKNISWAIKSRRMKGVGHVAHMGEMRGTYKVLVSKTEGKRSLG